LGIEVLKEKKKEKYFELGVSFVFFVPQGERRNIKKGMFRPGLQLESRTVVRETKT